MTATTAVTPPRLLRDLNRNNRPWLAPSASTARHVGQQEGGRPVKVVHLCLGTAPFGTLSRERSDGGWSGCQTFQVPID